MCLSIFLAAIFVSLGSYLFGRTIGFSYYGSSQINPEVVIAFAKKLTKDGRLPNTGRRVVEFAYEEANRLKIPLVILGGDTRPRYDSEAKEYAKYINSIQREGENGIEVISYPKGRDTLSALKAIPKLDYKNILIIGAAGHIWRVMTIWRRLLKKQAISKDINCAFEGAPLHTQDEWVEFLKEVFFRNLIEPIVPKIVRKLFIKIARGG